MSFEKVMKSLETIEGSMEGQKQLVGELAERVHWLEQHGGDMSNKDDGVKTGIGAAVSKIAADEGFISVRERRSRNATVALDMSLSAIHKSVVGDTGTGMFDVQPQRGSGIWADPRKNLSLFGVLPHLVVNSNAFEFHRLDSYTNAADYQANEGSDKAEGNMPTSLISAPICTIAHFIKASEQVLGDVPALQQQIGNLLQYGVLAKAESQLIAGSTAGKIQGLLTSATTFTATAGGMRVDDIGEAMTGLLVSGWNPGLIVMHPADWHIIRSERTATEKNYVAGGWANPAPPNIWGIPVVLTSSLTAGTALVLDASQCAILDRMQARVEVGRDGNDFTQNMVTIRAEMRIGLAIFSPTSVLKLTLSDS